MANNFNKAKETIVWITEVLYIRFPGKNAAHFSPGNGYIGTLPNQNYRAEGNRSTLITLITPITPITPITLITSE